MTNSIPTKFTRSHLMTYLIDVNGYGEDELKEMDRDTLCELIENPQDLSQFLK